MAQYVNFQGGSGLRTASALNEYEVTFDLLIESSGTQVITSTADSLDSFVAFRDTNEIGINPTGGGSTTDYAVTDPALLPIIGKRLQVTVRCEQVSTGPTVIETTVTVSDGVNTQVITSNDDKRGMDFDLIFARGDNGLGTFGRLYGFSITSISNNTDTLLHSYVAPTSGNQMIDTVGSENVTLQGTYTLENDEVVADSITVNDLPEVFYQRAKRGARSLTVTGTYTGAPSSLQYRIIDESDSSTVVDWTTFEESPSGGVYSLDIEAQGSINPRLVEVRFSNDTSINAAQTQGWTVGDTILIAGQSLALDFRTDGSVTPLDGYDYWNGSAFGGTSQGEGQWQIANTIIQSEGVAVRIINTSVGSTPLTVHAGEANYWNDSTGSLWTDTLTEVQQATNSVNELAFFYWQQGNNDATTGVTKEQYKTGLDEFFARVRSNITGGEGEELPIFIATLGRDTRGTPVQSVFDGIRQAEYEKCAEEVNTYPINTYSFEMPDGVHFSVAAYSELGKRIAATYYNHMGIVSLVAPVISTVTGGDNGNEIDLIFDTPIKNEPTYSTEGIRVTADGVDVSITSFTRKNDTTATITLDSALSGNVEVWFSYGAGSTVNALTYPKSEDITIPNTAITTNQDALAVFEEGLSTTSSITLNIGAPDGAYKVYLLVQPDNVVYNGNATFSGGSATISGLTVAAGTTLEGYTIDNESPHVNGAVITGVTV